MDLSRGSLVTVALQGEHGKPRPALVVQSESFPTTSTVVVLLLSSALRDAPLIRVTVQPTDGNGLRIVSQVMVDKSFAVARRRVGSVFGRLEESSMLEVSQRLALLLGIAA